jgi:hypothetical protein
VPSMLTCVAGKGGCGITVAKSPSVQLPNRSGTRAATEECVNLSACRRQPARDDQAGTPPGSAERGARPESSQLAAPLARVEPTREFESFVAGGARGRQERAASGGATRAATRRGGVRGGYGIADVRRWFYAEGPVGQIPRSARARRGIGAVVCGMFQEPCSIAQPSPASPRQRRAPRTSRARARSPPFAAAGAEPFRLFPVRLQENAEKGQGSGWWQARQHGCARMARICGRLLITGSGSARSAGGCRRLVRVEPARELEPFVAAGGRARLPARWRWRAWRRHARGVWPQRGACGLGEIGKIYV